MNNDKELAGELGIETFTSAYDVSA